MENQLYIPKSIETNLPSMVRNELGKLSIQKQEEFIEEYKRKSKSVGNAYLFFFLLGCPYGYMGKWGMQAAFWLTSAGLLVWGVIVLFTLPNIVKNHNKDLAVDVLRNIKALSQ